MKYIHLLAMTAVLALTTAGGWPPRPSPTPTPTTTTTSPPAPKYFSTEISGQCLRTGPCPITTNLPRSDAYCATNVTPTNWEPRPNNATANQTRGPANWADLNLFIGGYWVNDDANAAKVTGNYSGTTTQIIQWAACKWGIDEDVIRALAAKETSWDQAGLGDLANGCYHSFGIVQLRDSLNNICPINHSLWGGMPWSQKSTAVVLDIWGSHFRSCYDGAFYDGGTWLYSGETVNQIAAVKGWDYVFWGCVGWTHSGAWYDAAATNYIDAVKSNLANRVWARAGF